jgi:hypothetical protein
VRPDGGVEREQRVVATSAVHDLEVDLTGCTSRHDIAARVESIVAGRTGVARLTLRGEIAPVADFVPADLDPLLQRFEATVVRAADVRVGWDFDAIAAEHTVRGEFVREVRAAGLDDDRKRRVLVAGLRALDGRDDLETF